MAANKAITPLHERVRALILGTLEARGMNHTELAKNLGVGLSRVSQMLTGDDSNLTLRTLERIEEACDVRFEVTIRDALTGVTRGLESSSSGSELSVLPRASEDATASAEAAEEAAASA